MTQWRAARATNGTIAIIGDSLVNNERTLGPLRTSLQATYGNGGDGWLSAGGNTLPATSSVTQSGTWANGAIGGATSLGVDISGANSTDYATPAMKTFVSTATTFVIHYLKQLNGGSFQWRVDGGSFTPINTANAVNLFATTTVSGLSAATSHTLDIQLTGSGTAGVTVFGAEAKNATGVRVENMGRGSTKTSDWLAVDSTIWSAGLAAINPDVVMVWLGPNDRGGGVSPDTFFANQRSIAARIKAAVATANVVYIAPVDQGFVATWPMRDFDVALTKAGYASTVAFVDTYDVIGLYAVANALGWYADTTHLSNSGGVLVANRLATFLSQ